jgi:hypothetical protein
MDSETSTTASKISDKFFAVPKPKERPCFRNDDGSGLPCAWTAIVGIEQTIRFAIIISETRPLRETSTNGNDRTNTAKSRSGE